MSETFDKQDRVVAQGDFQRIHASRYFGADDTLVVKGAPSTNDRTRLGLSVSRRVGNAVCRNRWKRLIREAFRRQRGDLPDGWDFVVRPRKGAVPTLASVRQSLLRLTHRIDRFARREARRDAMEEGPRTHRRDES